MVRNYNNLGVKLAMKYFHLLIKMLSILLISLVFSLLQTVNASEDPMLVIYPKINDDDDRFDDLLALLKLALQGTVDEYGSYELRSSAVAMNEARAIQELKNNRMINLIWTSSSKEKEQELLPIRIPLRKGLLSYRISLINKNRQSDFISIDSISDLKHQRIGQGLDWGDIAIYYANSIPVITASYASLFPMLTHNRFDLFPRGVNEVFNEYQKQKVSYPLLGIEQHLLIYYPWPYYFFTSKSNPLLADRIRLGLERAIANGSFDCIFWKYNESAILEANLFKRKLIHLENPLLPVSTPLKTPLWLDPENLRHALKMRFSIDHHNATKTPTSCTPQ